MNSFPYAPDPVWSNANTQSGAAPMSMAMASDPVWNNQNLQQGATPMPMLMGDQNLQQPPMAFDANANHYNNFPTQFNQPSNYFSPPAANFDLNMSSISNPYPTPLNPSITTTYNQMSSSIAPHFASNSMMPPSVFNPAQDYSMSMMPCRMENPYLESQNFDATNKEVQDQTNYLHEELMNIDAIKNEVQDHYKESSCQDFDDCSMPDATSSSKRRSRELAKNTYQIEGSARFNRASLDAHSHPVILSFPGVHQDVEIDLLEAMAYYSTTPHLAKKSISNFARHIISKIYENPNASPFVTAGVEKSTKGLAVLHQSTIRMLSEFWMNHFTSSDDQNLYEIMDWMQVAIKNFLDKRRCTQNRKSGQRS